MNMRTLNFSELPGQDLNPKPMRKGHEECAGARRERDRALHLALDCCSGDAAEECAEV